MLTFSIGKPIFAMYTCCIYNSAIRDGVDQNSCSWQAEGSKEGERASLCLFCVSIQTHPIDASFHLSDGGDNERTQRGQAGSATWEKLPPSVGKGKGALGVRGALPYIILLFEVASPTLSPISWLAPLSCFPPGRAIRFFWFSHHSQMVFISYLVGSPLKLEFVILCGCPHLLWAGGL